MKRPEGCLSDFALDEIVAGEGDSSHAGACERCSARLAELRAERDAFAAGAPALVLPKARRRFVELGVVLAMAAVVVLFVFFRAPRSPNEEGVRAKGEAARLGFYVSHAGAVRRGGPNESVAPGDQLRFVVHATTARWMAVVSLDGARRASVYYPRGGMAVEAPAGRENALPESTTLDETLGDEVIYGVFCDDRFAIEPLRAALENGSLRAPSGCTLDELHLRKEASPPP